jgi:hypothetical protein
MHTIILTILLSLFASSIQTAASQVNTIPAQPYTAEHHFQEIKEALLATKYIAPMYIREVKSNAQMDRFINYLNEILQTEEPFFIATAMPFLIRVIDQQALVIPQDSRDQFKEQVKTLLEKRTHALLKP